MGSGFDFSSESGSWVFKISKRPIFVRSLVENEGETSCGVSC